MRSRRAAPPEIEHRAPNQPYVVQAELPKKRGRGRPLKLTPSVSSRICDAVRKGCYLATAAKGAGVSIDALQDWRNRGAEGQQPYADFLRDFEQAETDLENDLAQKWHALATKGDDFHAIRFLLATRFRERWSTGADAQTPGTQAFEINIIIGGDPPDAPEEAIEASRIVKFSLPGPDGSKTSE